MRLSNLHKTYISIALINAGDGAVGTILPSLLKESGFGVSSIGFIVSVFAVLSLVSRIPAGLAYKPKNASTVMRLCLGVFALSLPFYAVVSDATSLTLLRAVGGLAFGAATTLNMAVLMDALSSASSRARAMAFYSAFMSAGFAIGNSTSGWLADTLGYDWAFRLAAVLPLVAAVFSVNVSDDKIAENGSSAGNELVDGVWSRLRDALSGPVLIIALLAFSLNALHYLMNTFFPLFALGIGLSLTSVGLLRALHSIFGMVTRPLSGEATRVASNDLLANGGLVLVALLISLIPSFGSMVVLVPIFIALGTARGIVMVSNTIGLAAEAGNDPARRGMAAGVFNTAKDLGTIFGPIFGGMLADLTSIADMLRVGPIVLIAVYFFALVTVMRTRSRRPEVDTLNVGGPKL